MKDFRSGIKGIAAVYKPFRWRLAASVLMAPGLLALLHPGMVLILDEATSALDSATETAVLERFAAEYRGHRTILMITHRECALTYADEILRLD